MPFKPTKKQWSEFFNWFHSTYQGGCRMKPGDWDYNNWKVRHWPEEEAKEWTKKNDPHRI